MTYTLDFPTGSVTYYMNSPAAGLRTLCPPESTILITDAHVQAAWPQLFEDYRTITIPAGEHNKTLETVGDIIAQLVTAGADRKSTIVGIGGGVVTDITGLAASVFMRGVKFGYVPASLLAMVDAAIGGKNGVNVGMWKNMAGVIQQPAFIWYDTALLQTLPEAEWSNGFAEVIKYGAICDPMLLDELSAHDLKHYRQNELALKNLIATCTRLKNEIVLADEREGGLRKILNFGHTAGHALERIYDLPHGQAVAAGMVIACYISEKKTGLPPAVTGQITDTLKRYGLNQLTDIDTDKVMDLLKADKKKNGTTIDYILLSDKGEAKIVPMPSDEIAQALKNYESTFRTR